MLEKRGRKPKNPHHAEDVAHMISQFGKTDVANMTNNIRTAKKRYIDAIRDFDSKLVGDEDMSLDELSTIIRNNGIDLTKQIAKEKAWQKLENDVARGI